MVLQLLVETPPLRGLDCFHRMPHPRPVPGQEPEEGVIEVDHGIDDSRLRVKVKKFEEDQPSKSRAREGLETPIEPPIFS